MAFVKRKIEVTITLGTEPAFAPGQNTITLDGPRCSVQIANAGLPGAGLADVTLHGLTLDHLNRLSSFQLAPLSLQKNIITIKAGDDISGMPVVFTGLIMTSWADMNGQPDVSLKLQALDVSYTAIQPCTPTTYQGSVDAATVAADLAAKGDYKFENNGVSGVILNAPYLSGTVKDQIIQHQSMSNIGCVVDNGTLAIWPNGGSRTTLGTLTISPSTGMVGYPSYNGTGVNIITIFNPNLRISQTIEVQSSLKAACGKYIINSITHILESETPGGAWYSNISTTAPPGK